MEVRVLSIIESSTEIVILCHANNKQSAYGFSKNGEFKYAWIGLRQYVPETFSKKFNGVPDMKRFEKHTSGLQDQFLAKRTTSSPI